MNNSLCLILLLSCCLYSCFLCRSNEYLDEDFYADLWSENNRLNAQLYLDVFEQNLDTLTYDYYLNYLKINLAPSAKGLPEKIETASEYLFETKKTSFMIILLYEEDHRIVADIATTAFLDTLINTTDSSTSPDLKEVAGMLDF